MNALITNIFVIKIRLNWSVNPSCRVLILMKRTSLRPPLPMNTIARGCYWGHLPFLRWFYDDGMFWLHGFSLFLSPNGHATRVFYFWMSSLSKRYFKDLTFNTIKIHYYYSHHDIFYVLLFTGKISISPASLIEFELDWIEFMDGETASISDTLNLDSLFVN